MSLYGQAINKRQKTAKELNKNHEYFPGELRDFLCERAYITLSLSLTHTHTHTHSLCALTLIILALSAHWDPLYFE